MADTLNFEEDLVYSGTAVARRRTALVMYPLKRLEAVEKALAEKGSDLVAEVERLSDDRVRRKAKLIRRMLNLNMTA